MSSCTTAEINSFWEQVFLRYSTRVQEVDILYPEMKSIAFTWMELCNVNEEVTEWVCDHAMECIPIGEKLLRSDFFTESVVPSDYDPVCIRITELPKDKKIPINKLKHDLKGRLISVSGMIRKLSSTSTYMSAAYWECKVCEAHWVERQDTIYLKRPALCPLCKKGAFKAIVNDRALSHYRDYQDGELQESPEGLTGGRQPQSVQFVLKGDLTSKLSVGAKVILNGILRLEDKKDSDDSTITSFVLEVVSVETEDENMDEIFLTEEDIQLCKEISNSPTIIEDIAKSIAPSIYGFDSVKLALALQLAGGVQVHAGDGTTKRGDIHILLIGDPGTAKSQMLKSASVIASRSVFASGKSATAAGLTATAARQTDGRWTVEAGALVLADGGMACVDELDKMREEDRASLHSAMEDQCIFFAKAGMTMTLRTKCSLLAAANPKYGRFEDDQLFTEQIDLPPSLISRFDLIFVITDVPNKEKDDAIVEHILSEHALGQMRENGDFGDNHSRPARLYSNTDPIIPLENLKRYIAYARKLKPVLTEEAEEILKESFTRIRQQYSKKEKVIGITFRQMDGYIRLATASAKLHLRQEILEEDATLAVTIIEQYLSSIANDSGISDIDAIMTSIQRKDKDVMNSVLAFYDENGASSLTLDEIIQGVMNSGYTEKQIIGAVKKLVKGKSLFKPDPEIDKYTVRGRRKR